MKSPLADTDLISARKAAIAYSEESKYYSGQVEVFVKLYRNAKGLYPIFFLAGMLTAALGILIASNAFHG